MEKLKDKKTITLIVSIIVAVLLATFADLKPIVVDVCRDVLADQPTPLSEGE